MKYQINLIFLIKPGVFSWPKIQVKILKHLENENSFLEEIENIFHHF